MTTYSSEEFVLAARLVATDVRQVYPGLDDLEALGHALNTVALDGVYGDDPLAEAYRVVLRVWTAQYPRRC